MVHRLRNRFQFRYSATGMDRRSSYWLLNLLLCAACMASGCHQPAPARTGSPKSYTTHFSLTENPVFEGGKWSNGRTDGIDWFNVATQPGLAYGTQLGGGGFDDSTALLTGEWGPSQTVQATVHSINQSQNDSVVEEVELRLRSSISPHRITGYEINFRCSKTGNSYTEIVRWNGPLGDFTYLDHKGGSAYGVANGDVVKATMIGNQIVVYVNGMQVLQATDGTYVTGNPGIGFGLSGSVTPTDFGFSNFTASD